MGVVRTKEGVQFSVIHPGGFEILSALALAASMQNADLEITCGTEGHPADDHHTYGEAYDLSIAGLTGDEVLALCQRLQATLGAKFTVLYEVPSIAQALRANVGNLGQFLYINSAATAPHVHVQVRNGATYP